MWLSTALLFRSLDTAAVLCKLLFDTLNLSSSSPAQTDYSHTHIHTDIHTHTQTHTQTDTHTHTDTHTDTLHYITLHT